MDSKIRPIPLPIHHSSPRPTRTMLHPARARRLVLPSFCLALVLFLLFAPGQNAVRYVQDLRKNLRYRPANPATGTRWGWELRDEAFDQPAMPNFSPAPGQGEDSQQNLAADAGTAAAAAGGGAEASKAGRVKLEAHLMSKCPDARDCIKEMVIPAMEEVYSMVDFRMEFIGSADPDSDDVTCKHGPPECLGNQLMLCGQHLYPPPAGTILSLGFANCLFAAYARIPEHALVHDCALEHAVDFSALNTCVSDEGEGNRLLRESVDYSKREGVVYSCTVRVEGETWCVRDGGVWRDCQAGEGVGDLVGRIKELHAAKQKA